MCAASPLTAIANPPGTSANGAYVASGWPSASAVPSVSHGASLRIAPTSFTAAPRHRRADGHRAGSRAVLGRSSAMPCAPAGTFSRRPQAAGPSPPQMCIAERTFFLVSRVLGNCLRGMRLPSTVLLWSLNSMPHIGESIHYESPHFRRDTSLAVRRRLAAPSTPQFCPGPRRHPDVRRLGTHLHRGRNAPPARTLLSQVALVAHATRLQIGPRQLARQHTSTAGRTPNFARRAAAMRSAKPSGGSADSTRTHSSSMCTGA